MSDNHRWTQHRSFAVSGQRVMADSSIAAAARCCPRKLRWLRLAEVLSRLRRLMVHLQPKLMNVEVARSSKEVSSSSLV